MKTHFPSCCLFWKSYLNFINLTSWHGSICFTTGHSISVIYYCLVGKSSVSTNPVFQLAPVSPTPQSDIPCCHQLRETQTTVYQFLKHLPPFKVNSFKVISQSEPKPIANIWQLLHNDLLDGINHVNLQMCIIMKSNLQISHFSLQAGTLRQDPLRTWPSCQNSSSLWQPQRSVPSSSKGNTTSLGEDLCPLTWPKNTNSTFPTTLEQILVWS